jgi:hypothetical protein
MPIVLDITELVEDGEPSPERADRTDSAFRPGTRADNADA